MVTRPSRRRFGIRWIIGSFLVAAIVFGCIEAGFWQLRRLDQRRTLNARIRQRSAATVALPRVTEATDPDDLAYRRVAVTGTYDRDHEVLVRFRSRAGLPGYEVVTPLRTADGELLVDRGWVPLEDGDRWPVADMAAPTGEVTVEGLLAPSESGSTRLEHRPDGVAVINAIDPAKLAGAFGDGQGDGALYPVHLLATDGGAGVASSFPTPVDPPSLSEGPHKSYAVQWFLFASVGIAGWPVLLRTRGPFAPARSAPASEPQPEAADDPDSSASMASSTDADLVT